MPSPLEFHVADRTGAPFESCVMVTEPAMLASIVTMPFMSVLVVKIMAEEPSELMYEPVRKVISRPDASVAFPEIVKP